MSSLEKHDVIWYQLCARFANNNSTIAVVVDCNVFMHVILQGKDIGISMAHDDEWLLGCICPPRKAFREFWPPVLEEDVL